MITATVKKSVKLGDDYSIFLSFPYNEYLLNIIRAFRNRAWHKETKEWEIPIEKLADIMEACPKQDIEVLGTYVNLSDNEEVDTDFNFKTVPYSHQKECFEYGLKHNRWFLGDEMGLGKSKQSIDIAVAMKERRNYKHCLILCGVNSLKWNWYNEVHTHSNEEALVLGTRIKKRTGEMYVDGNKSKLEDLNSDPSQYFLITNIESLRDKALHTKLLEMVNNKEIPMIIIDESHKCIKNVTGTQQGKALLKLQPEYRLAMSGTPLMNSPFDLYGILKWLGYESHSFYQFKHYYGVFGGYGGYEVVGYRHLDELEEELNKVMLRRKKEEVLDLPNKVYVDDVVEMLAAQSIVYYEVKSEIKNMIDKIVISPNPLASMIRLRQSTGYTGILSTEIQCSAKLDRMEELVEEARENGKQVVIFSNWTQMTDAIYERLHKQYTLSVITGQTSDDLRQHNVDEFQAGRSTVMIGTIGAMGTGLTLTKGSVVIFLDEPWSKALKEQAVDRCHRIGQKDDITIHTIMCKDTIDEKIHKLVENKGKLADSVVDGVITGDKRELIEYLLD